MPATLTAFLILAVAVLTYMYVKSLPEQDAAPDTQQAWNLALGSQTSPATRAVLSASRPLANLPGVKAEPGTALHRTIEAKLLAAGGLFGRSVDVFITVQTFCALIGVVGFGLILFTGVSGPFLYLGTFIAVCIALYPIVELYQRAGKQAKAVSDSLPEFAELLQMPLSSGLGTRAALSFTANRLPGPVSDAVHGLLNNLSSRAVPEDEAFDLAGSVLGTPEAVAFFNAIKQADQEGSKVSETLSVQAAALRAESHQRSREQVKKLGTKVMLVTFVHFIPGLLIVALIPAIMAFVGLSL